MSNVYDVPRAANRATIEKVLNGGPGSGPHPGGGSTMSDEDRRHLGIAKVHRDTAQSQRDQADSIEKDNPGSSMAKELRETAAEHDRNADEEIGKMKGNIPMPGGHVQIDESRIDYSGPRGSAGYPARDARNLIFGKKSSVGRLKWLGGDKASRSRPQEG